MTLPARAPCLILDAQHGLANRLRAMVSGAVLARATGRRFVLVWRPDHHCAARLSDLLDWPGPVIEDDGAERLQARAARVLTDMECERGATHGAPRLAPGDDPGGDIYIRTAYTLAGPHHDLAAEQRILRALRPAAPVRALLARAGPPAPVAAHVREGTGPGFDHLPHESPDNWPAHRHAELVRWRATSRAAAFEARLDALIAAGEAGAIFLAADRAETYDRFAARYGDRLRVIPRSLYDRSARQLQYALADMMALARAPRLLASSWSSFSDLAHRLARSDQIVEKSGTHF